MSNVGPYYGETAFMSLASIFDAYDKLPPSIRQQIRGAHLNYSSTDALDALRSWIRKNGSVVRATERLADNIKWAEGIEIAGFSDQHDAAYGCPLPHVAAGATICRPDSARRRRPITGPLRLTPTRSR